LEEQYTRTKKQTRKRRRRRRVALPRLTEYDDGICGGGRQRKAKRLGIQFS